MAEKRCRFSTEILPWVDADPELRRRVIDVAVRMLRRGGLVAYPTETVYGLAAPATCPAAVKDVFAAKGRPRDRALLVAVRSADMLPGVVDEVTPAARRLMKAFWPGPLSLILPRGSRIPDIVTGGRAGVGVRCPDHPAAQQLIETLGEPITSPSANRTGRPSGRSAPEVLRDLNGRIAAVIDGGTAPGTESTLVDLTGEVPRLLRRGAIEAAEITALLGPLEDDAGESETARRDILLAICTGNTCRSPLAAAILNARLGGVICAESAGTAAEPGTPPPEEAVRAAEQLGHYIGGHRARALDDVAWDRVAMVITMTHLHVEEVRDYLDLQPGSAGAARILSLGDLVSRTDLPADVADPFGGSAAEYREMAELLDEMIAEAEDEILRRLSEEGAR